MYKDNTVMIDVNILIVDDEPANIQVLHASLKDMGRVQFATNGQKAIEIAKETPPDIVFLDLVMPGMDGLEVCDALKNNPSTQNATIIFVSGDADEDQIEKALAAGAFDFMSKPIIPVLIRHRMKIALMHGRLQQQETISSTRKATTVQNVLIVEDGEINRMIISEVLKQKNYEIATAATAKEALQLAKEQLFDCILLDIHLPDMTGLKVIQHIREMPGEISKARIIAVTGDVTLESLNDYSTAGFDGVSPKPIDPDKLLALVAGEQVDMEDLIASAPDAGGPDLLIAPERMSILKQTYRKDKLNELYDLFVSEVSTYLKVLKDFHTNDDAVGVTQTAHRLKSALGHFACAKMQNVAELLSKDIDLPVKERERLIHVLEDQLSPTLKALTGALDIKEKV